MNKKTHSLIFSALVLLYAVLSLALPPDPKALAQYHITHQQLIWLDLTFVIPLVAIYFTAFYGYIRFRTYAQTVRTSREGTPLVRLSEGLGVLAYSLPISASLGALLNYLAVAHPNFLPTATILKNYINVGVSVAFFILLAQGAQKLVASLKTKLPPNPGPNLLTILILASLFIWAITTHQQGPTGETTYYLPNWLIISTLAIPYLYAWIKGITAVYQLMLYQTKVKGSIYRHAVKNLAFGIAVTAGLSIFIQLFSTFSVRLSKLHLTPILLIVYILVALYVVAFGFIAQGAKQLKKIEEA